MPGSVEKKSAVDTFRWYLVKIEDLRGNYVRIEYAAEGGGMISKIYYTLHPLLGASSSYFMIEFLYEGAERSDRFTQYRPGYYLNIPKGRLSAVKEWLKDPNRSALIRKYVFSYKYSALTNRSLLAGITEYGSDEKTALPPISFSYNEIQPGYTVTALNDPADIFADFNGDGFSDLGSFDKASGAMKVRLFVRGNFSPAVDWITNFGKNCEILIGELNGDGRADILAYDRVWERYYAALSDGRRFVDHGQWLSNFPYKGAPFLGSVYGSGESELIIARSNNTFDVYSAEPYIAGFDTVFKEGFFYDKSQTLSTTQPTIAGDFDGDGIMDICDYKGSGNGWTIRPFVNFSRQKSGLGSVGFGSNKFAQPADVNSDGLTDVLYYDYTSGKIKRRIFNGREFIGIADAPFAFNIRDKNTKVQTTDFNGDGLTDYVACYNGRMEIAYSKGNFTDILTKVQNGIGASLELEYRPSSAYTSKRSDGTPALPFVIPVFYRSNISDGRGNAYATIYSYAAGLYDTVQDEFAGFGFCMITDQDGNYTEKFFHQNKPLRGKAYREKTRDKNRQTFAYSSLTWGKKALYRDIDQIHEAILVYLEQRVDSIYDGDLTAKDTGMDFEYDDYGNPTRIIYQGDTAINGDEKTNVIEYNHNTLDNIFGLPSLAYTLDQNNNKISEKRFYYDNAASYTAQPLKGLLTKEEVWLYNPLTGQEGWLASSYRYDSFGGLIENINPNGQAEKIEYDASVRTYPVRTVNHLGHVTSSTYNYGLGKPLMVTDANKLATTYQYDALGRLIAVIGPYDNGKYPGLVYSYNQLSRPTCVTTIKRVQPLTKSAYVTYGFYDGLGRMIETKIPLANNKSVIADAAKFNFQGRKKEAYLPFYVNSSSADYSPVPYGQPKATVEYDCLGRVIKTINPDETFSQAIYSDRTVTFSDENNNQRQETADAWGRATEILEYNGGQVYRTIYEYSPAGNLIRIMDDQNNQISFDYDSLGRKLRVDDPDMGVWNYEYDALGNLIKQTDALGQLIIFEYDGLNRVIYKKGLSREAPAPETLASYIYDDPAKSYCIGALSKVTDRNSSSEFFYDKLARVVKSIKTIDTAPYVTESTYDGLGRQATVKYPDGSIIKYDYNVQGAVKVSNVTIPSKPVVYVSTMEYSASGQLTKTGYGNNTFTNYTYDQRNLRLANITTQTPRRRVQDLNYSFDNVGNISHIQDNANTASQDFLYDGLNRLIQASGAYGVMTYGYDSIGNMTHKEGLGFVYGRDNLRPHAPAYSSDGAQYLYDDNGSLLEEYNPGSGRLRYSYDLENHLAKVEPKPQEKQEFALSVLLSPGWNFFSLPVIPKDTNISRVLGSLRLGADYDQVTRYNSTTKSWEMFTNQPEFDQFFTIEYGRGYQIYVTNPAGAVLTVQGYLSPTESEFPVSSGWQPVC